MKSSRRAEKPRAEVVVIGDEDQPFSDRWATFRGTLSVLSTDNGETADRFGDELLWFSWCYSCGTGVQPAQINLAQADLAC